MKWTRKHGDASELFALVGAVDEHAVAALAEIEAAVGPAKRVALDLARTTHFNSIGLAAFVRSADRIRAKASLALDNCPMNFVRFVTMLGSATPLRREVLSLRVPHLCDCGKEFEVLRVRQQLSNPAAIQSSPCPGCKLAANVSPTAEEDLEIFLETMR